MAAVYKSLSKKEGKKPEAPTNGIQKNKQRVLILSSRGVTYRYEERPISLGTALTEDACIDIATS